MEAASFKWHGGLDSCLKVYIIFVKIVQLVSYQIQTLFDGGNPNLKPIPEKELCSSPKTTFSPTEGSSVEKLLDCLLSDIAAVTISPGAWGHSDLGSPAPSWLALVCSAFSPATRKM